MPSLYQTSTNYTASTTVTNSLYAYATSGTVITGTVQTSYMPGLYQGTVAPQPTAASGLIQYLDNNGNVNFYLDPQTNNTTIYANALATTTSTTDLFTGNSVTKNFTLSKSPLGQAYMTVNVGGVIQEPGLSWTLSGSNTLAFTQAPITSTITNVMCTYFSSIPLLSYQGLQGTTGTQGTIGPQGLNGTYGSTGTQGTQGIQGLQGPGVGLQGTQGTSGTNGTQGAQGTAIQGTQGPAYGTQGTQGTVGPLGPQGPSGSGIGYYTNVSSTGSSYGISMVGTYTINQSYSSVAIGAAGPGNTPINAVAGFLNQGRYTVAIGSGAGSYSQGNEAVAIGWTAGNNGQGGGSVAIGSGSGAGGSQGQYSVAIGYGAGQSNQGNQAIAIGLSAGGGQTTNGIAIGNYSGDSQGNLAIALGYQAGGSSQVTQAIAIGYQAGQTSQGQNAIAIGQAAGQTNQAANSIVLNATGSTLDNTTASSFVVKPVRHVTNGSLPSGFYNMAYNPTTGEIIYWT